MFNHRRNDSSIGGSLPSDSDVSRTSSYSGYSSFEKKSLQSSKTFRIKAQKVAGAFASCFIPQHKRKDEGSDEEDRPTVSGDISITSTSKISTASSSGSKYRFSIRSSSTKDQEKPIFTMADIYKATSNFAEENKIGEGGFGAVYKGKLKNGTLVAVKCAKRSINNKHLYAEFKTETEILSKIEHLNLVRLLGCLEQDNEYVIVVEYVSNGNLREFLDGTRGIDLDLEQRLNIAIDVAHALAYLHNYTDHPIIHRDIKASNILLTENLRAKVADFGFARLAALDPDATHVSTQIKGTSGYLDPEYINTFHLTEKSDVYSFGVVLVELVTGRRPIERNRDKRERITTRWAMHRHMEGNTVMVMDPRLRRSPAGIVAVEKVMGLAVECMAPTRRSRPAMKQCAEVLWRIRKDYKEILARPLPLPLPWMSVSSSRSAAGAGGLAETKQTGDNIY